MKTIHPTLLVLGALSVLLLSSCTQNPTNQSPPNTQNVSPKVITPDWSIAQTLIALEHPPIATGDINSYADWASTPAIPRNVVDVGLRFSPNAELFAQLDGDLIIDNAFYQHLRPLYKNIPHQEVSLTLDETASWKNFESYTHQIGKLINKQAQTAQYLKHSKTDIAHHGALFRQKNPAIHTLAIVQFANAQNYRLYTKNSLFYVAVKEMGLTLHTPTQGNTWGFANQNLGDLAQLPPNVCLIIIRPFSQMLEHELNKNILWQNMGFGRHRCMMVLPPVWISGGVPSLVNFSHALSQATVMGIRHDS